MALVAPNGYGKTTQLAQWRKEASAQGVLSLWYSADKQDEPLRLARGLTESALASCTTYGFGDEAVQAIRACTNARDALTAWLAEIAFIANEVLLIIDDLEKLPAVCLSQTLPYLLRNAPSNLRIAVAAQPSIGLHARGVLPPEVTAVFSENDLRFKPQETRTALAALVESELSPEIAVQLHQLIEGWPLGAQLAAATLRRGESAENLLQQAQEDLRRYFIDTLIDQQTPGTVELLVRLSQFDPIHPELCDFVFELGESAEALLALQHETPLLLASEVPGWMRLHPLAQNVLLPRLQAEPMAQRQEWSRRAYQWYAKAGMHEQAAEQALIAGDTEVALNFIEENTRSMTEAGRSPSVLSWYERMSESQLDEHPGYWAPVAWALAMSERHAEAEPLVVKILKQPDVTPALKFEAAIIRCTVASFADDIDALIAQVDLWPEAPENVRTSHIAIHAISVANAALLKGDPDQCRRVIERSQALKLESCSPVTRAFAGQSLGFAYLWGGQFSMAKQALRGAITHAEEHLGHGHSATAILASILAQACWETGAVDEAKLLLAGRIPALEAAGLPVAIESAYLVNARLADAEGRQDRALTVLDSLHAIGRKYELLRLQVTALAELVKLHCRHARAETAYGTMQQLRATIDTNRHVVSKVMHPWLELQLAMAGAGSQLIMDTKATNLVAQQEAQKAVDIALQLKRMGDLVEARLLLAEAMERDSPGSQKTILNDAFSLASANGMSRLMREHELLSSLKPRVFEPGARAPKAAKPEPELQVTDTILLTPKEREVLLLLSKNFSNKEIARVMSIGIETVKWHIKNLSGKLHAGNRKHAVARARMLGLFSD